jgi:hypothetical protein
MTSLQQPLLVELRIALTQQPLPGSGSTPHDHWPEPVEEQPSTETSRPEFAFVALSWCSSEFDKARPERPRVVVGRTTVTTAKPTKRQTTTSTAQNRRVRFPTTRSLVPVPGSFPG